MAGYSAGNEGEMVTVHRVNCSSGDRRDIPVPTLESAGLENPAYRSLYGSRELLPKKAPGFNSFTLFASQTIDRKSQAIYQKSPTYLFYSKIFFIWIYIVFSYEKQKKSSYPFVIVHGIHKGYDRRGFPTPPIKGSGQVVHPEYRGMSRPSFDVDSTRRTATD